MISTCPKCGESKSLKDISVKLCNPCFLDGRNRCKYCTSVILTSNIVYCDEICRDKYNHLMRRRAETKSCDSCGRWIDNRKKYCLDCSLEKRREVVKESSNFKIATL